MFMTNNNAAAVLVASSQLSVQAQGHFYQGNSEGYEPNSFI